MVVRVHVSDVKKAIQRAERRSPEWQAEMLEIALIPGVKAGLNRIPQNHRGVKIKRVKGKFGNGYVLEGWNSVRDDYFSYSPSTAWDGLRREYYGAQDIERMRMAANQEDPTAANYDLRHFKLVP